MTKTKNILLIGKTGSGKSTLANVLINENNKFEEVFREGKYGVSQTRKVHAEEFEHPKLPVLEDKMISGTESIENAQTIAKQHIESLFKERNKVEPSNLDKDLWKNKSSWEEYLKELKTKDEILKFIKLLKEELTIKYRIIDTVGISDTKEGTKMSIDKVLYNLAKVGHVVKDGLSQILLVTDGKNWEQEISLYNLLKETVFDNNISQYTTTIRTRFTDFEEEEDCAKDRQIISESVGELREVISVIHVDNPPLVGHSFESNKKTREISREILLKKITTYQSTYKPANLDKLNEIIAKEWKDKELLKEKINKVFIKYIKERGSNLKKEVKDELKEFQQKVEKRELDQTTLKEDELSKQIGSQLIKELRELNSYLPKNKKFVEWKRKIEQLERELVGEEERKLISEITIGWEDIIRVLEENIREKRDHLRKVKDDNKAKIKEATKKSKKLLNIPNLFEENNDKNWIQEDLEKVCQAQVELTKSETELKVVKKILERIETYKEKLDQQQLEAKVEVLAE